MEEKWTTPINLGSRSPWRRREPERVLRMVQQEYIQYLYFQEHRSILSRAESMQVDWGQAEVMVQGEPRQVWMFCARLAYSTDIFVRLYPHSRTEAFLDGLRRAFEHLAGWDTFTPSRWYTFGLSFAPRSSSRRREGA